MNEVEKKEIEEMAKDIQESFNDMGLGIDISECINVAESLSYVGYGKVEDYKKEIEKLKEENQKLRKILRD